MELNSLQPTLRTSEDAILPENMTLMENGLSVSWRLSVLAIADDHV